MRKARYITLIALLSSFLISCQNKGGISTPIEEKTSSSASYSIQLSSKSLSLRVGESQKLTWHTFGTSLVPSFASEDQTIATISSAGVIQALKAGQTNIIACIGDKKETCTVLVENSTFLPTLISNANSLSLETEETYYLKAKLYLSGEELPAHFVSGSISADSEKGVFSFARKDNGFEITALAPGNGTFLMSSVYQGHNLITKVDIHVHPKSTLRYEVNNFARVKNGYQISLYSHEGDSFIHQITPEINIYQGSEKIENPNIIWESQDSQIAYIDNSGILVGNHVGNTCVKGKFNQNGEELLINLFVKVEKPHLPLNLNWTIETSKESTLNYSLDNKTIQKLKGESIEGVYLFNHKIGSYDSNNSTIQLDQEQLPTFASEMGSQTIYLQTENAYFDINADIYTCIITSPQDFLNMGKLAKQAIPKTLKSEPAFSDYHKKEIPLWDGYFILKNDIDLTGRKYDSPADSAEVWTYQEDNTTWQTGLIYGFRGVLDGKGFNVKGLSIDESGQSGGVFGVLHHDGVIKNISFTDASLARGGGFIASAGCGTIENVYVKFSSMGFSTNPSNRNYGVIYPQSQENGGKVNNCFFDAYDAQIQNDEECLFYGSNSGYSISKTYGVSSSLIQVGNSFSTLYSDYDSLVKANISLDNDYFTVTHGIPVFKNLISSFTSTTPDLVGIPPFVIPNHSIDLRFNMPYVKVTLEESVTGVSLNGNTLIVDSNASVNTLIKLKLESYLNPSLSQEKTLEIKNVEYKDLSSDSNKVIIDLNNKTCDFSSLQTSVNDNIVGFLLEDGSYITYDQLKSGEKTISCVGDRTVYYVNAIVADHVLTKAEDLSLLGYDGTNNITDYFYLNQDIDCSTYSIHTQGKDQWNSAGFCGTFNGGNHTIKNLTLLGKGLFGSTGSGAVIENCTFEDVTLGPNRTFFFGLSLKETSIKNVSIHMKEVSSSRNVKSGLLAQSIQNGCSLEDVTINGADQYLGYALAKIMDNGSSTNYKANRFTRVNITMTNKDFVFNSNTYKNMVGSSALDPNGDIDIGISQTGISVTYLD